MLKLIGELNGECRIPKACQSCIIVGVTMASAEQIKCSSMVEKQVGRWEIRRTKPKLRQDQMRGSNQNDLDEA